MALVIFSRKGGREGKMVFSKEKSQKDIEGSREKTASQAGENHRGNMPSGAKQVAGKRRGNLLTSGGVRKHGGRLNLPSINSKIINQYVHD